MNRNLFDMFQSQVLSSAIDIALSLVWLWLPLALGTIFFYMWIRYARTKYINDFNPVLLELKLPKQVTKSPAAMELIISAMHQPSVGSYLDVYMKGRIRPWFSLELVSLGGQVKFFIWTPKKFKDQIETQIYSQFPNVEVHEVPDYALTTNFDPSTMNLWGTQLKLTKADAYPIKTYVDYGLDKDPKEEYKIDPITPLVEFLGALRPAENVWIQILIQAHKKENLKDLRVIEKPDWKKGAEKEIKDVIEKQALIKPEKDKPMTLNNLTEMQKETVTAIQRNLAKTPFETMIRGLYFAPNEVYNPGNIGGLTGGWKQFGSGNLNGFAPNFTTGYDYPWQDFRGKRALEGKVKLFDAYRRRSFFHPPYRYFKDNKPFILTTEELATIFHFPGEVASTPTLDRAMSKKSEAPSNLPV